MRWYFVFLKSIREQIRDYWILLLTISLAPFFVFMYYMMVETETPEFNIILVNHDEGTFFMGQPVNLGDSLIYYMQLVSIDRETSMLHYTEQDERLAGIKLLQGGEADVMVVIPRKLTLQLLNPEYDDHTGTVLELVGDVTDMQYIIAAVWSEELINRFIRDASGISLPVGWKETTLGYSGQRTEFELYVPGMMILAVIMMIFSASATIVREPEAKTLERLKISNLSALEFLGGISLIQVIIAIMSLLLTMLVAVCLGYTLLPGTFWFIMLVAFLTSLSMIAFSLIVAAICRSIKDVAIIGTFPLFILMFFTGAAFPISGGKLFTLAGINFHFNDILSPTWAVDALNKVLIKGQEMRETIPDLTMILVLTLAYFIIGVWAFRRRHMRAA
ncbi:MAG: ABC transporter permease [Bacteroidales bacterium]|jgi:ABC-2 type transport system permease protein